MMMTTNPTIDAMQPDPMNPPPVRSVIPKVIGILMIIFGAFAMFGGLFGLINRTEVPHGASIWATMSMLTLIFDVFGLLVGGLQLYAGIRLLGYKDTAPKLAMIWGGLNIATAVIFAALMWLWLRPKLGPMGELVIGFTALLRAFISIAWSAVVIALVGQPSARQSCNNF